MTPMSIAPTASAAGGTAATPWWVAPAVIAALIAATVALVTLLVSGRRNRIDRQRVLCAEAFGDVAGYCEYVYIVRRRRHDEPEAERVRISNNLSEVQRRLNQHSAVLKVEAPRVARAFDDLVRITRHIAGSAIRDAWNTPPITEDNAIHVEIDLSAISTYERMFLTEVSDHLSAVPSRLRRQLRPLLAAVRQGVAQRRRRRLSVPATTDSVP